MSHRIQTPYYRTVASAIAAALMLASCEQPREAAAPAEAGLTPEMSVTKQSGSMVPTGPWGEGDQQGMANTLGGGTWLRCSYYLAQEGAKSYELSHVRSNDMTQSPFGVPLVYEYRPTVGIPGTKHAFNGEQIASGEPAAQGTQMDALGHFAYFDEPWDGQGDFPADAAKYYGGYSQSDVKPTPDSPLMKLGIENVPPIITSAILLDARAHLGNGEALAAGRTITAADIEAMIEAQGLGWRGLMPGDVLYIYTGWSDIWETDEYYTKGPGLANDALAYIEEAARGHAGRAAVRHSSLQPDAVRHPPDPEHEARRTRARQGLDIVYDNPAASIAGQLGIAGSTGCNRRGKLTPEHELKCRFRTRQRMELERPNLNNVRKQNQIIP
jgi:hypothetical protein